MSFFHDSKPTTINFMTYLSYVYMYIYLAQKWILTPQSPKSKIITYDKRKLSLGIQQIIGSK